MLRDYQIKAIDDVRQSLISGHKRPILCLPTGAGKTHCAIGIIQSAIAKGKRVMFIAPRRELIFQTHKKFIEHKLDSSMIMAGEKTNYSASVQVASIDTLTSRASRNARGGVLGLPPTDIAIIDECHLYDTEKRSEVFNMLEDNGAVIIGLTATPAKGNGKGLGKTYDDLIIASSVREMTEKGWLAPVKYYGGTAPDTAQLKVTGGDYNLKALAEATNKKELNGDIVENWLRIAKGKSTVVFCVDKKHSRAVCDAFLDVGVKAEHLDCDVPDNERKEILERVASGETTVLCNVFIASYGLDIPSLEVAVMARPTKSIVLYWQCLGRVLRPHESKTHAIIIDHADCVGNHGFIDQEPPWSLSADESIAERQERKKKEDKEPREIECSVCSTIFKNRRDCPSCGHSMVLVGEPIPHWQFDLEEITKEKKKANNAPKTVKSEFYGMLKGYARTMGYSIGWASHQYRKKFGVWPNAYKDAQLREPNKEVSNWIRSRQIAWAKGKKRA